MVILVEKQCVTRPNRELAPSMKPNIELRSNIRPNKELAQSTRLNKDLASKSIWKINIWISLKSLRSF